MERSKFLFLGTFIFIMSGTLLAYSGVSPSSYEIDFEPNLKNNYLFNFFLSEDAKSEIFVEGDLKDYIFIDKKELIGQGQVIASVKLPEKIDVPGVHYNYIRAREVLSVKNGVGISLSVGGVLKIRVPYPGKYAELALDVKNVNTGEPVKVNLEVFSRGNEDIIARVNFEIRDSFGKLVATLQGGEKDIESTKSENFSATWYTSKSSPGNYNVSAVVEYGGEAPVITSKEFRLGELYVDISNYTKSLEKNKINRFEIEVESFWNGDIDGVYAEIIISENGESFRTPSISLGPWQKTILTGFLDTSLIKENPFDSKVTLHYGNKTTSKDVKINLIQEVDYKMILIILGLVVLILVIVFIIIYIKRNFKFVKNEKHK